MTVQQLIEELKKHNQDAKVVQSAYHMSEWTTLEVNRVAITEKDGRPAVILHLSYPS